MSLFMTVSGNTDALEKFDAIELVPAQQAQLYIVNLEEEIIRLDGGPVFLVHDKETLTSENIINELASKLFAGDEVADVPLYAVLKACFKHEVNFRIWDASEEPGDVMEVEDLQSVLIRLVNWQGVSWHAKK